MTTRRVRVGAAAGAAVVLLAGAALVFALTRNPAGGSPPPQTLVTNEDLAKLRAEAAAAARNLFARIDEADATGNPAVLDGLYTEGAKALEESQKKGTRDRLERGVVSVKRSRVSNVRVTDVTPRTAVVHLDYQVLSAEIREAKSKKLIERQAGGAVTPIVVSLERIDDHWLVARVDIESQP